MFFLIFLVLLPICVVVDSFCLKMAWGWFVAPLFHLQPLTFLQAAGLMLVVNTVFQSIRGSREKDGDDENVALVNGVIHATLTKLFLTFVVGGILHLAAS